MPSIVTGKADVDAQDVVSEALVGIAEPDAAEVLEAVMTSAPSVVVEAANSTLVGEMICVEKVLSVARSTVDVGTKSE